MRELDLWIATEVMGWTVGPVWVYSARPEDTEEHVSFIKKDGSQVPDHDWVPSRDFAQALDALRMARQDDLIDGFTIADTTEHCRVDIDVEPGVLIRRPSASGRLPQDICEALRLALSPEGRAILDFGKSLA